MTCIVGLVHQGRVFMGADSAGLAGLHLTIRRDRKIGMVGPMAIGFTTSFRMGQLLLRGFTPPRWHWGDDPYEFLLDQFVDAVRNRFKAGGYVKIDNGREDGGTFLIGLGGRLFSMEDDFQIAEAADEFDACGCGEAYAKGALAASANCPVEERLSGALRAAERFSAGVRGPFHFVTTDADAKAQPAAIEVATGRASKETRQ